MTKLVLDTNVFVSGIFWSGPPAKILNAWHEKKIKIVCSLEILDEYSRVSDILLKKYPSVDIAPFINLMIRDSELFTPIRLKTPISRDPDDDKFIAVALAANCHLIVSGDNDLLSVTGYKDIEIINPNEFVSKYLK
ncbi:MAG: putative toxin-antitoxin system toxin component, PIN family [Gammaproteobacteria bacterium]|nr:MAG: putative toxin-antitoxin system toxin component, PIN family [Gammaproteobacteria bacterium]